MLRRGFRLLGAAALAAALAVSRPCVAAEVDPFQRVRTGAQILGFLGLDFGLLFLTPPPAGDPPGNVRLIDKLTLKAWSFDASAYETNFVAHPLAGTFYYTTARSNRLEPLESLGLASLASLTWELAEFPENVSFNDLIVTPVAGASIGESLVQLSRWLDRGPRSPARSVLSALLFPMKLVNGGPPPDESESGAFRAGLSLLAGSSLGVGPEMGVRMSTRLVHFPGFGEPGEGSQLGFGGNVSQISVDARGGRSGLADLRFTAGASMATLYQRSIDTGGQGWDLLVSGGVVYDFRQHAWGDGPHDAWSSVHVPGLGLQLRRIEGPFRATLRADLALTFAGVRSFVLDGAPELLPVETLTTTQQSWGYTMGFGLSAAPSLELAYGPLSLDLRAAIDTRYGALGADPWPDRHPSASITDSWSTLHGGLKLKLPWNDLQLSASLERNLRRGSAAGYTRTVGETVALVGLGIALE
jgi:hypothetical protein